MMKRYLHRKHMTLNSQSKSTKHSQLFKYFDLSLSLSAIFFPSPVSSPANNAYRQVFYSNLWFFSFSKDTLPDAIFSSNCFLSSFRYPVARVDVIWKLFTLWWLHEVYCAWHNRRQRVAYVLYLFMIVFCFYF